MYPINNEVCAVVCPLCKSEMVLRKGKYGDFWGCSSFPRCRSTLKNKDINNLRVNGLNKRATFVPSKEQQAIYDWLLLNKRDTNTLVVEACAGSGKTTTIRECINTVRDKFFGDSIIYLVFGKENKEEALRKGLPASTTHQYGFAAINAYTDGSIKVDINKVRNLIKSVVGENNIKDKSEKWKLGAVSRVISLLKNNYLLPSKENIDLIFDMYYIEVPDKINLNKLYKLIEVIFYKSAKELNVIDFDDMLFLPLFYNMKLKQYTWVFADEVQDFNACQIELLKRCVGKYLVAVGDRNQSCYYFRGAMLGAMDDIKTTFNAKELPLSITWRVPKVGGVLVNELFPHIKFSCPDMAKSGVIDNLSYFEFLGGVQDGDLILCRTNAPLIKPVLELLKQGKKASIRGRDLLSNLINLIKRFVKNGDIVSVETLLNSLTSYCNYERGRLERLEKFMQADILWDKFICITAVSEGCLNSNDVIEKLNDIFSTAKEGIIFSSVHRAKGLEADNVFILKDNLMPHPSADSETEKVQEQNIKYVAYTRFKNHLIFVDD